MSSSNAGRGRVMALIPVRYDGGPLPSEMRIAVATVRGRPYYYFSSLLKGLGVRFDSILPQHMSLYGGNLVLTTASESKRLGGACLAPVVLFEDVAAHVPAVVCGLILQRTRKALGMPAAGSDLVIGIDPGQRSGLAVSYCGREIEMSTHSTVEGLVSLVACVLGHLPAGRRLVRIGDGDMRTARDIIHALYLRSFSSFELEVVDESRTSPKIRNFNCRGRRDILSACYISRRDGRHGHPSLPFSITE